MSTICGVDCTKCGFKDNCKGCEATCGNPHGEGCLAAQYITIGGKEHFEDFKKQLIKEINELGIDGMPAVTELNCLCGFFVNLEYPIPSGQNTKLLKDGRVYLGTQVQSEFDGGDGERCFGVVCDTSFILVCEYGINGINPEIVCLKRR